MIRKIIKNYFPQICLVLIVLAIFIVNYKPGTYLMGWDNLQTDLDPGLGIKRAFFGVWQEYQSFGLASGLAYGADLIRSVFIWLIASVVPASAIRYLFHILMLVIGSLGMYTFLSAFGIKQKKYAAFLGALFYLLNFGTIQIFAFPWEAFSIFFAFLPWEMWIFIKILSENKGLSKKNLIILFITNLLSTPQSYIPTIFIVYIVLLACISLGLFFSYRTGIFFKKSLISLLIIIFVNLFWLLPQFYFIKSSGNIVREAKSNSVSTEDTFLKNQEKGNLPALLRFESRFYDSLNMNQTDIFQAWKNHFKNPFLNALPYLFFLIALCGIYFSGKYRLSFVFILFINLIGLLNATFPFSFINDLLRQNSLLNQIFRSPFTKFIIPQAFIMSCLFSYGIAGITDKINLRKSKYFGYALYCATLFLLIIYSFPSFRGNYILPEMKVKIPKEYFELMDYFKHQDKNKRIALLPDYTFWGWFFHKWGYDGSGFLWYGIEQPVVSRTFDVWSSNSEGYFWEIKNASEEQNQKKFEKILEKYAIDYLLIDYSLIPVSSSYKGLQYDAIKKILNNSQKISIVRDWQHISLYEVKHTKKIDDFISIGSSLPNIGPNIKFTNDDYAYYGQGDYITNNSSPYQIFYPYLDFFSQTRILDKGWEIAERPDSFTISKDLGIEPSDYRFSATANLNKFELYRNNKLTDYNFSTDYFIDNHKLTANIQKKPLINLDLTSANVNNCSTKGTYDVSTAKNHLKTFSSKGAVACYGYDLFYLPQRYGYLIKINNTNLSGRRLYFYIQDKVKQQIRLEDNLDNDIEYYILNPGLYEGLGYSMIFSNISYENLDSVNELNELVVYPINYEDIKKYKLIKNDIRIETPTYLNNFAVQKNSYFSYTINFPTSQPSPFALSPSPLTLILYQSYHPGWEAYQIINDQFSIFNFLKPYFPYFFGEKIENHFPVNNWANGWRLRSESFGDPKGNIQQPVIIILFWPQYLEFMGFALLFLTFIFTLRYKNDQ